MVCGVGGGVGGGNAAGGEVLVGRVAAVVPGTTESSARQALHIASGDYQGAVRFLKIEKLYRSAKVLLRFIIVSFFFHDYFCHATS